MKSSVLMFILVLKLVWCSKYENKELKQVVIMSRHNLRTPLSGQLNETTPKVWPRWKEKWGHLTEKGAMLEGYMGQYFASWLQDEKLLPEHCPSEDEFYAYANIKQRTKASAAAFVTKGFPNCDVTVHFSNGTDPVFNAVIHNSTDLFKEIVQEHMLQRLKSLYLNDSYLQLDSILDYKNSNLCVKRNKCDLLTDKNKIAAVVGEKPNVSGPLKIANSAVDAFLMEYYEGFPDRDVAWGMLAQDYQWRDVMNLNKGYHDVRYNTSLLAADIAHPLIKYISSLFSTVAPKVTLLMGHDSNIYTLTDSLRFKPYYLPQQFELIPVGGKIVFQKWLDTVTDKLLLRIDYVYQSSLQLRTASRLSLNTPPQFHVLELEACEVDTEGFCPWNDFVRFIDTF